MRAVAIGLDMTLLLDGEVAQRVPLKTDEHGVVRIGGTRIPLDTVVAAHKRGERPEDIVASYDSLKLGDVYAVIGYYLAHRKDVDEYLAEQEQAAEALRAQIEADPRMSQFRTRLQALKTERQAEPSDPLRR